MGGIAVELAEGRGVKLAEGRGVRVGVTVALGIKATCPAVIVKSSKIVGLRQRPARPTPKLTAKEEQPVPPRRLRETNNKVRRRWWMLLPAQAENPHMCPVAAMLCLLRVAAAMEQAMPADPHFPRMALAALGPMAYPAAAVERWQTPVHRTAMSFALEPQPRGP